MLHWRSAAKRIQGLNVMPIKPPIARIMGAKPIPRQAGLNAYLSTASVNSQYVKLNLLDEFQIKSRPRIREALSCKVTHDFSMLNAISDVECSASEVTCHERDVCEISLVRNADIDH